MKHDILAMIHLLDEASWLKTGPANMLACVHDTRTRMIANPDDYDALENCYGLIGLKDPYSGITIARQLIALEPQRNRSWQCLLEAAEATGNTALAYHAARRLYRLAPSLHHSWQLARAAHQAGKHFTAKRLARKTLALLQASTTAPGTAVLDTLAQAGLIEETGEWLYQQVLEHDDIAHWQALRYWQTSQQRGTAWMPAHIAKASQIADQHVTACMQPVTAYKLH